MARCPNCKVRTQPVDYEATRLQMCGQCGGYWIDPLALKRILHCREQQWPEPVKQKFMEMAEQSDTKRKIMCLRCGVIMHKEQFKDWQEIVIDRCGQCQAIWLDPGELEKIQIYWEYAQDHPDQEYLDQVAKKAVLDLEWQKRKTCIDDTSALAKSVRDARSFGPSATAAALLGFFSRLSKL